MRIAAMPPVTFQMSTASISAEVPRKDNVSKGCRAWQAAGRLFIGDRTIRRNFSLTYAVYDGWANK